MEMTTKQLENLWDAWTGSKEMLIGKGFVRPVNFLGSVKEYKKKFLNFARGYLNEQPIDFTFELDVDEYNVYVNGYFLCVIPNKPKGNIKFLDMGLKIAVYDDGIIGSLGILTELKKTVDDITPEAMKVIKPHLYKEVK